MICRRVIKILQPDEKRRDLRPMYTYTKSSACRPASSTSRSRKQPCISICFLRVTLTVVVGTGSTVLFAYIYSRRKSLSFAPPEPSCTLSPIQINKMTEGSDPTDDSRCCLFCRPDSVMLLICVGVFEQIRGKTCTQRFVSIFSGEKTNRGRSATTVSAARRERMGCM